VTYEEYADLEGINASVLKEGRRSMKHLQYRLQNAREDTIRLGLGRAAHCLVLEPENFDRDFAVWTGARRQGKQWDAFCKATAGRTRISAEEYEHAKGMADAIAAHPIAGPLMRKPGESEKVIQWTDPLTDVPCKGRIDRLTADEVIDVKTSAETDSRRFGQLAARYGYHLQAAFYVKGLRALEMERVFKFVVVEPLPPHDVAVVAVTEDALYAGEEELAEIMRGVATGIFSGLWPGRYEHGEVPLELPSWVFPDSEVETDLGIILGSRQEE
jgi:hypothetical protein